ncbi:MAG: hypothetical protein ACHQM4_09240 [Thermoanaerobaculia bacterium]
MRTNASVFPAVAAAFLLAASAATLPGCAKPEAPPAKDKSQACTGPATTVTVFVEWDGTLATTRNKTVYACEGRDSVEWVSCVGEISENISWKNGSPFAEPPKHDKPNKKNVLNAKPPKAGTAGHEFDYTVEFVPPGGKPVPIDPRIVIMP